ncbi:MULTISPECIES: type II toxin-antitoxin system VapC family toxin [Aquimarina]|uniref:Type II toxin-antitoxin system VapC family toxin n=1 Tax=Aquimarina algiphila TaxID=2047982 RepID=A0A554VCD5_9FLAO|nr:MULTISPECIES: type II toxin-antitoxin system VapC family toxin [Aquimarina]TSE04362.1 type II toxin-antitoxin system VapC family toxin [Aquimarina algiphila]
MIYLIDTHVFLWWVQKPEHLSKAAFQAIEDNSNTIYVSTAVAWEINIKMANNKLEAPENILSYVESNRFIPLDINYSHANALLELPEIHTDPFDRIQIAQAHVEDVTFVTRDTQILKYDLINTIKA